MMLAASMRQYMPVNKVAQYLGVCDTTVKKWNKKVLKILLGEPDFDNLQLLMVDEKSIGKGHSYITVALNGESGKLLHLAEGKKKESLKAFFDKLTSEQKASIIAVCIDRSGAYSQCIKDNIPQAELLDNFKYALSADNASQLHRRLVGWLLVAGQSCRKEIVKFADNMAKVFRPVVNSARFKLNNGRFRILNGTGRGISLLMIRQEC